MIENNNSDKKISDISDEELKEVAGGWTATDTADYNDITFKWHKAIVMRQNALKQAIASGDPVAVKEAQEAYNRVLNEPNLCEMRRLYNNWQFETYSEAERNAAKNELTVYWSTFDYQHYSAWLETMF